MIVRFTDEKHMFSVRSVETVEMIRATPQMLYGKYCRNGMAYANLSSVVFRTYSSATYAYRPTMTASPPIFSKLHCWLLARHLFQHLASGARDNRPGLAKELEYLQSGDVDKIFEGSGVQPQKWRCCSAIIKVDFTRLNSLPDLPI